MAAKRKPTKKPAPKPKRGRPPKGTPDWSATFLVEFSQRGNITDSCRAANIDRTTFYARIDSDPSFKLAYHQAEEVACDTIDREIWRRAIEGWEEPVFGSGGVGVGSVEVGKIRKYHSGLLVTLARSRMPGKYREHYEVKHSGRIDTGAAEDLTDDELARIAATAKRKPG